MILPAVTGYIFAGFRFAVIIGWNGVLLAEWFGSANGVGWRTRYRYDANRYQGFVGWILLFIVIIVALDRLVLTPRQNGLSAGGTWQGRKSSWRGCWPMK